MCAFRIPVALLDRIERMAPGGGGGGDSKKKKRSSKEPPESAFARNAIGGPVDFKKLTLEEKRQRMLNGQQVPATSPPPSKSDKASAIAAASVPDEFVYGIKPDELDRITDHVEELVRTGQSVAHADVRKKFLPDVSRFTGKTAWRIEQPINGHGDMRGAWYLGNTADMRWLLRTSKAKYTLTSRSPDTELEDLVHNPETDPYAIANMAHSLSIEFIDIYSPDGIFYANLTKRDKAAKRARDELQKAVELKKAVDTEAADESEGGEETEQPTKKKLKRKAVVDEEEEVVEDTVQLLPTAAADDESKEEKKGPAPEAEEEEEIIIGDDDDEGDDERARPAPLKPLSSVSSATAALNGDEGEEL